VIAAAVSATALLMFAVTAQARWLGVTQVGESSSGAPLIAFDPAGNAALAFGHDSGVDLVGRREGGAFGAAQFLPAGQDKGNLPGGLVLPKRGETVLMVVNNQPYGPVEPWQGLVRPAGSSSFGPPQPLGISSYHYGVCCGWLLGDARGETIDEISNPYSYRSFIRVLAPGASRFGPQQRMPNALIGLVADGAGGLFDVWCRGLCDNPKSNVMVGYRPFGGTFSHGVRVDCGCEGYEEVAAAGGRGHIALVWFRHHNLYAALGGPHGFSSGRIVARGAACVFDVQAVVTGRGNPVVAWEDCSQRPFRLRVAFGNAQGRFTRPQTLGTASPFPTMAGDARGDLIIAWNHRGSVLAATCHAKARTCGPATVLSTTAASSGPVVAFGPRGEAIVAWSQGSSGSSADQPVFADVYQLSRS
jgi:hypothetical protein